MAFHNSERNYKRFANTLAQALQSPNDILHVRLDGLSSTTVAARLRDAKAYMTRELDNTAIREFEVWQDKEKVYIGKPSARTEMRKAKEEVLVKDTRIALVIEDATNTEVLHAIAVLCHNRVLSGGVRVKKFHLDELNALKSTRDIGVLIDNEGIVII